MGPWGVQAGREKAEEKAVPANCNFFSARVSNSNKPGGLGSGFWRGHGAHARMGGTSDLPACGNMM